MGAGDELDREIDEYYREKPREPGPGPERGAAGAPAGLRTRDGRTQEELVQEMENWDKDKRFMAASDLAQQVAGQQERVHKTALRLLP